MAKKKSFTVSELSQHLNAKFSGDGSLKITGVADLGLAAPCHISFISNKKYISQLKDCQAGALLIPQAYAELWSGNAIYVDNPYLAYAQVAQLLDSTPDIKVGIHPSAVIGEQVTLGNNVAIGANVVIGDNAVIGDGCQIAPGCVLGEGVKLGAGSKLWANVTVYHAVEIGAQCIIHSGAVIGADGFGFAPNQDKWEKIPQLGRVVIGSNVEIGANCTIDRGALKDTIIGNNVILDNLIHIAHNVTIDDGCAMAAMSVIAGSTHLGKGVTIGGGTGIVGHINIADGTHITARTFVNKEISEKGVFSSGTTMQTNREWRKSVARFKQLDDMAKRIKQLEQQLINLQPGNNNE